MIETLLIVLFSLVFIIIIFILYRILFAKGFLGFWFKGSLCVLFIVSLFFISLTYIDFLSYQNLTAEEPIATVSIFKITDQYFDVTVSTSDGVEQRFSIYGDQWQLDARLLTWSGPLAALGKKPLYRLGRMSGRYADIQQARARNQSVYDLDQSMYVDIWKMAKRISVGIDANYGSAVYMPMENGAIYSVYLTAKGMNVRPLNEVAKEQVETDW